MHGHSDGQAEDFLPEELKKDYNRYRRIIIDEVSVTEFILLVFIVLRKLRYLA